MDNLQQQNLIPITPLMAASIAVVREWVHDHAGDTGTDLLDGVIHAFRSEPEYTIAQDREPIKLLLPDCTMSELAQFKAEFWNKYSASIYCDPFLESDDPWDAFEQLSGMYEGSRKQNEELREANTRLELEKGKLLEELEQVRHLLQAGHAPEVKKSWPLLEALMAKVPDSIVPVIKSLPEVAEIVILKKVSSAVTISAKLNLARTEAAGLILFVQQSRDAAQSMGVPESELFEAFKHIATGTTPTAQEER